MRSRFPAIATLVLAACSYPTTNLTSPDLDSAPRTGAEEEEKGPEGPGHAREWRLMRWRDENGNIAPDARARARAEARANADYWDSRDGGGIGPFNWRELGPNNIGGRTRALVIHPTTTSRMWAGSVGGGVWRSDNSGASWYPLNDWMGNLAVCCLALDPNNANTLYAGTGEGFFNGDAISGEGIWRSTDGGLSWTQLASTAGFGNTNRIAVSQANSNVILAATSGGIRRSTDAGATWTTVRSANTSFQVLIDPNNANNCVAHVLDGSTDRVVYSTNNGASWTNAATGLTSTTERIELAYARSVSGTVYASVGVGQGQIWRSTNGGINWTQRPATGLVGGTQWWYDNAIWVDPTNSNRLLVGAVTVWRSLDGGSTFTEISPGGMNGSNPHSDVHFFTHDPGFNGSSNLTVYVSTDGGVYRTSNYTTATTSSGWVRRDSNYRTVQYYGAAGVATGRYYGGTQDNGTHTINFSGSTTSATVTAGADGGFADIDPTDPNYLYGETQWLGMHRSTNGGASASAIQSGLGDAGGCTNFIAPFLLDPNNVNRLLAGGCSLWRCNNAKAATPTWASIKSSIGSSISAIAVAPGNSNVVWIGHNNGHLYRTANATAATPTWTTVDNNSSPNPLPNRYVGRILIDRTNTNLVYVGLGGFNGDNLWRTTNNGTSWTDVTGSGVTGLPSAPVYGIAQHPSLTGRYYVSTEVGVFGTSDNCVTWSTSNDGPADVSTDEVRFVYNSSPPILLAATHGRGMWTTTIVEGSVSALGTGCAGSNGLVPNLTATAPRIGFTVTLNGTNLPRNQFAWLVQGNSSTSWLGNSLPFNLSVFGANNCFLRVSADSVRDAITSSTGTWSGSLPIAASTSLLGNVFHLQFFVNDPRANSWGKVVSNALTLQVGN